jgi:hypothetical protein
MKVSKMQVLSPSEMTRVSGAGVTEVDGITVYSGSDAASFYQQTLLRNMGLTEGDNPLLVPVADGGAPVPLDIAKKAMDALAKFLIGEAYTSNSISERDGASTFNRDDVDQRTKNGVTFWVDKNDKTVWFDMNGNGQPETHFKVFDDGSVFMDSDFNGTWDWALK